MSYTPPEEPPTGPEATAAQPPTAPGSAPNGHPAPFPGPVPTPSHGIPGQAVYATWGQRAGAVLIDIALCLPLFIVGILLAQVGNGFFAFLGAVCYLAGIAAYYYFAYLNGANGRSPGKAIVGLRTVDYTTGQHLGGGKGILRYLIAGVISALTCGLGALADYLWPLFDNKLQTIHDKAIGSIVLNSGDPQPFSQDLFLVNKAPTQYP